MRRPCLALAALLSAGAIHAANADPLLECAVMVGQSGRSEGACLSAQLEVSYGAMNEALALARARAEALDSAAGGDAAVLGHRSLAAGLRGLARHRLPDRGDLRRWRRCGGQRRARLRDRADPHAQRHAGPAQRAARRVRLRSVAVPGGREARGVDDAAAGPRQARDLAHLVG